MLVWVAAVSALTAGASGEQVSEPASTAAGRVATGSYHTCAILAGGSVRCWGYGASGQLGYGSTVSVGDDETPASVGPVDLGGHKAVAVSAGDVHSCALLDDGSVRCWGFGGDGRLGYGNSASVGGSPGSTPSKAGPVDLGAHKAVAVSAGSYHTCAILDDGSVRCWGFGAYGQLGYGNRNSLGATPATTPGRIGPVDLGAHTAVAISAGGRHTCAILDDGSVRCWGLAFNGQLGYGNTNDIGATPDTTPGEAGPVDLGPGRTAKAISAGFDHTCAVLDDGSVRCWGYGFNGALGYGNTQDVGATQTPGSVGPVDLGRGHRAVAISAGAKHTCAIIDDASVRCWGYGADGRLGYGNQNNVGDIMAPGSAGAVYLGSGRSAKAIGADGAHTCALLDNESVRCWGQGASGELGHCNTSNVGDTPATLPGRVGPVNLEPGDGGVRCAGPGPNPGGGGHGGGGHLIDQRLASALRAQAARARNLRTCLATARRTKRDRNAARSNCLKRYGRTPGRVTKLNARATSRTTIVLTFAAPGSDATTAPAARAYLIKQSTRPIRSIRELRRAQTLCHGRCHFKATAIGTRIKLTISHLHPHRTYYYTIAARDNVTGRLGPRSRTIQIRTAVAPHRSRQSHAGQA